MIELIIVFDNYLGEKGFETGWGYSCLIKRDEEFLLFDTGEDGQKLIKNLQRAGLDPTSISKVVISHAHKDHTGGLKEISGLNLKAEIYVGASFYEEARRLLPEAKLYKVSSNPLEIIKGVFVTGELEGPIKETSLAINTKEGLIIITGCAHPGVKKIIEKTTSEINPKVFALLGGLHLLHRKREEILDLLTYLESKNFKHLAPSHCTGDLALKLFQEHFKDKFLKVGVGTHICWRERDGYILTL
ncbi:MBL fold metallo-hydrolase [Thermodesulfobacterium sp. TA1]|uniref:MBL fold metallo-hydrolase n=1 Tax=Thermodesulfobacterium sp. TA1 TaxID=2234087 RepID=UPI001231934E|nr:MBL fold metallo-hydrolase [Thermodesulfobacterium sp. TA1]QER41643.1 MBL fold metallo-hydrolase [Thermodesulfobacterium sp. TA1]